MPGTRIQLLGWISIEAAVEKGSGSEEQKLGFFLPFLFSQSVYFLLDFSHLSSARRLPRASRNLAFRCQGHLALIFILFDPSGGF